MVIGATNPSAERRERAAIRAVLEKIRPPIDVDAMLLWEEGLVVIVIIVIVVALPFLSSCASRGELRVVVCGDGWRERRRA